MEINYPQRTCAHNSPPQGKPANLDPAHKERGPQMDQQQLLELCAREEPGFPGPERGTKAAKRVTVTTKRRQPQYRADQRRATPQEAKDAATLCRWLNSLELTGEFLSKPIQTDPEKDDYEQIVTDIIDQLDSRHMLPLIAVEGRPDGTINITASVTPRDTEWTGLSPMWKKATGSHTVVLTDPYERHRPVVVLLHDPKAAELLQEEISQERDTTAPNNPLAATVAALLKHHEAEEITWNGQEEYEKAGNKEWDDTYTWSDWHRPMNPDEATIPKGWLLTKNLTHVWMLQHPNQALTLARYAAGNAQAAIHMSIQARQNGREQAATGAAETAQLMAQRADTCMKQTEGLTAQNLPNSFSKEDHQETREWINKIRREAAKLPKSRLDGPNRWYADACHRLLRHKSCNTLLTLMGPAVSDPNSHPYERYLMAATTQQMCAWPSDNIYEIGNTYPIGREPDPGLARTIRQCEEEVHALWARILALLQQDMGLHISTQLQVFPALTERLSKTLVPLIACDAGFEYADVAPNADLTAFANVSRKVDEDLQDINPNARPIRGSIGWTGFYWENARIFKATTEPYPKGYPAPLAAGHIEIIKKRFAAMVPDDLTLPPNPALQPFYDMTSVIEAAVHANWHTIDTNDIQAIDDAATQEGLSTEERHSVFRNMTGGDGLLFNYLRFNSHRASLSTTHQGTTPAMTNQSAERIRTAVLKAGFPPQTVRKIQAGNRRSK